MSERPESIAIDADDYHARYVGKTVDGQQFFVTTPFVPAIQGNPGREFVARYDFDSEGNLVWSEIVDLGPRNEVDKKVAANIRQGLLDALGPVTFERIVVKPFEIERFGITFGLIAASPDDDIDEWTVVLEPGNYMAFFEPWDSGEYDT